MTASGYVRTLDELDRLLNDPDVPIQPDLIWCLLEEVAKWERGIEQVLPLPLNWPPTLSGCL
jgi:hypothetical protein